MCLLVPRTPEILKVCSCCKKEVTKLKSESLRDDLPGTSLRDQQGKTPITEAPKEEIDAVSSKKQKLNAQNGSTSSKINKKLTVKKEKLVESKLIVSFDKEDDVKNLVVGSTKREEENLVENETDESSNKKVKTKIRKVTSTNGIKSDQNKNIEESDVQKSKKSSTKSIKKNNDTPVTPPLKYESLGCGPSPLPATGKKYVGCHVSASGGVWKCFSNGKLSNASSIALFLRNQRSWNAKPLDDDTVNKWNETIKEFPPHLILPHGSYLMNLGSPKSDVLAKSRHLFIEELQRCEKLGIPHFNFHPGSSLGEISREECCKLISESINIGHKETSSVICVIENMSRQGFTVGGDFHEIRLIIEGVEDKSRVGVCIDTCHAHAAGYDLGSEKGFNEMVTDFEKIIGWQFLRALHINDSKGKVGDHKDRHEVIGEGFIGEEGFKRVMNYPRFNDIPLILETPFVSEDQYAKEIKLLQSMVE